MTGDEARAKLRATLDAGGVIIGAGAGTGLSAKCEEAGGVDLIVIYNSGRFRMAGRGSLAGLMPYGDANAIVMEMGNEVLPVVKDTPVLAGVCGTDPFRLMPQFLRAVRDAGFAGVQNFPTVVLIPRGGVSALDIPGGPFHDPEADAALFGALAAGLAAHPRARLVVRDEHINDPAFADAAAAMLLELLEPPSDA